MTATVQQNQTPTSATDETNPQSKIQIVTNPVALPGQCVICLKSANGVTKFVDSGSSDEFYGAFYFCQDCVGEMARAFGFVLDEERELAFVEAVAQAESLKAVNEQLNRALDSIGNLRTYLYGDGNQHVVLDGPTITHGTNESSDTESGPAE